MRIRMMFWIPAVAAAVLTGCASESPRPPQVVYPADHPGRPPRHSMRAEPTEQSSEVRGFIPVAPASVERGNVPPPLR